jgi:hypothetical protein
VPKRPSTDPNEAAAHLIEQVIASGGKNPAAGPLGRLGGPKGGRARAEKLSAKQRSAIARKGGLAKARKQAEARSYGSTPQARKTTRSSR